MEDFDQRNPQEELESDQGAEAEAEETQNTNHEGSVATGPASAMGERPSILGDRATGVELPQRPSILGESDRPRTGPEQRPSITGRERPPLPPSQRRRSASSRSQAPTQQKPAPPQKKQVSRGKSQAAKPTTRQQPTTRRKTSKPDTRTTKKRTRRRQAARKASAQPEWLKNLRKEMPPYADEILALLLIAIGLVSLLSLIGLASGDLADAWARFLSRAMGLGAALVPMAVLIAGGLLLMPKLGLNVQINWLRIISGELFFVSLLGYLHLINRDPDPWAVALSGKGGGWIGWSLSAVLRDNFGPTTGGFILLVILVATGAWTLGIGRRQVLAGLTLTHNAALAVARAMEDGDKKKQPVQKSSASSATETGERPTATSIDASELPAVLPAYPGRPSIITGRTGAGATNPNAARRSPTITRTRVPGSRDEPDESQIEEAVAEAPSEDVEEKEKKKKKRRHNFTVDDLPDRKRTGRRSTVLPPLELLDSTDFERPAANEVNENAEIIEDTLDDFGMNVEVVKVQAGPTVTQYAVQPFTEVEVDGEKMVERVRVTQIASLDQDLALALSASRVRIEAPVPGESYVGVEVPNDRPGIVSLRPVMESEQYYKVYNRSPLALALGRDVAGVPVAADLAQMPHLLIAGTTGSGKSVAISAMTTCLITNNSPYSLRLIMIDPKMVELIRFNGLPHLLGQVEVDMERIIGVLRWATREMDRRYKVLEQAQARNILIYNRRLGGRRRKQHIPHIVIFIDELADLMSFMADETERVLVRLAQMARAVGIHLVVATQRPSTDVVTGLIKANFPARLSFAVASSTDSRVILDATGAQQLIGRGDMLFMPPEAAAPQRIQGCFVSDGELERVVDYWVQRQESGRTIDEEEEPPWERSLTKAAIVEETDDMLEDAIALVQHEGTASASLLQRKLNVGFPRAARLMDALHDLGIVGEDLGGGRTREVLIDEDVDPFKLIHEERKDS